MEICGKMILNGKDIGKDVDNGGKW